MSLPASTGEGALAALKTYAALIGQRKDVLADLAQTSREMRSLLQSDATADIHEMLSRREAQCLRYADVCCTQTLSDEALVASAATAARGGERESASVAMRILSLYEDAQDLADEVMTCQAECESILRDRLQVTAKALKQSSQRRRLDAAYGPACRHDVPFFMDKHR